MSKYIITYNGLDNNNTVIVSSQIALDIDVSAITAAGFLELLNTDALSHAVGLNNNVSRIAIVRVLGL
ncbi:MULTISPECIES: hypothetical protein [Xenorhabdus]|uniref:Uncharacterized protein n=1 Tax=Xenorhabdus doucetiae TaxID=351671 RepID=A0A068QS51_9GAMM|nr:MULTISPECIES: hypothetical protein [Xenorhabdus]MDC9580791.1 hypothetical protein [Xenorhabdus sp. PR6a]TYP10784.1 hypothetical protein LY16_01168 [Xenorhabdus doucetiae]CDG17793.1 protein of unknown function [Xenorhabdus doucetiae]